MKKIKLIDSNRINYVSNINLDSLLSTVSRSTNNDVNEPERSLSSFFYLVLV